MITCVKRREIFKAMKMRVLLEHSMNWYMGTNIFNDILPLSSGQNPEEHILINKLK